MDFRTDTERARDADASGGFVERLWTLVEAAKAQPDKTVELHNAIVRWKGHEGLMLDGQLSQEAARYDHKAYADHARFMLENFNLEIPSLKPET